MFSGMTNHSIDAKGRIVLPAKSVNSSAKHTILHEALATSAFRLCQANSSTQCARRFLHFPQTLSMAVQYTFNATAVEVTPNAQGRVIIPQSLREFAEIEGDAVVIGMTNRLEIWSKKIMRTMLLLRMKILHLLSRS